MLRCLLASALPLVCGLVACRKAPESPSRDIPAERGTSLQITQEPAEVFRRAFWRDPSAADQILHAERREWVSENDGVRRWQWFLAIQPGTELTDWLQRENPFQTGPVEAAAYQPPPSSPAWFPTAAVLSRCKIQRQGENGMTLIFDPGDGRLYATDSGHGFSHSTSSATRSASAKKVACHRPGAANQSRKSSPSQAPPASHGIQLSPPIVMPPAARPRHLHHCVKMNTCESLAMRSSNSTSPRPPLRFQYFSSSAFARSLLLLRLLSWNVDEPGWKSLFCSARNFARLRP
jgi:hypothetical protein